MSGLDTMNLRLNYRGGKQEKRMIQRKLETLKKAMLYSYQAATIQVPQVEGEDFRREFKCLINKDNKKIEYDHKILSIPYKDICLNMPRIGKTSEGQVNTNIAPGQVIHWNETDTNWLVYLEYLEEDAYFRGEIVKCHEKPIKVNDKEYFVYVRGPVETDEEWRRMENAYYNTLNYSLVMYVTKDDNTLDYFHRFTKLKFDGKNWEVQVKNEYGGDGIIILYLKEDFNNKYEDEIIPEPEPPKPDPESIYIDGPAVIYPYDKVTYTIVNDEGGTWEISNNKAKILNFDNNSVTIEVLTGKSANFNLTYIHDDIVNILLIKVESF